MHPEIVTVPLLRTGLAVTVTRMSFIRRYSWAQTTIFGIKLLLNRHSCCCIKHFRLKINKYDASTKGMPKYDTFRLNLNIPGHFVTRYKNTHQTDWCCLVRQACSDPCINTKWCTKPRLCTVKRCNHEAILYCAIITFAVYV